VSVRSAIAAAAAAMLTPPAMASPAVAQQAPPRAAARTLVAVVAHADDEVMVAPVLARCARDGVQVYLVIATDGAQGGRYTTMRGPELATVRAQEARCATDALGIQPPLLLGFPDGTLGDHAADPSLLYRLAQRVHEELQRLPPDAVITFGPDAGPGIRPTGSSAPS
jgi:LmbE family N-acetylglucosaminyl deacetylase